MTFNNPLDPSFTNLTDMLTELLKVVMIISTPFVVFFIIFAGFTYVTARGNPEKIKQASKALTYAIIGGVIIIGSAAIVAIVKNVATSF